MEVKGNRVRHLNLLGDFFVIGDLNRLLQRIQGCELTEAALSQAIPDDIDMVIRGLHKQQLIDLLVNR